MFFTFESCQRLVTALFPFLLQESPGNGSTFSTMLSSNSICVRHPSTTGTRACLVSSLMVPLSTAIWVCLRVSSNIGNSVLMCRKTFGVSPRLVWKSFRRCKTLEPKSTSWTILETKPTTATASAIMSSRVNNVRLQS